MAGPALTEVSTMVNGLVRRGAKVQTAYLAKIAEAIGRTFSVQADEVAVLARTADGGFLRFCVPEQLQTVGQIPMSSGSALAARTAREKKAEIVNHFNVMPHASVFEAVRLNEQQRDPIQKIMSAPILSGNKVVGVVQISRKAKTSKGAKDFMPLDLRQLVTIAELLAPALPLFESSAERDGGGA